MTPSNSIPENTVLHDVVQDARRSSQIVAQRPGLSQLEAARRVADVYAQTQARVHAAQAASPQS